MSQCSIELVDGSSIHVDTEEDGSVLLALNLGPDRDGVMMRLPPAVAAYLAGQLASRSGARLG